MSAPNIRLATLDDAQPISELSGQLGYPSTPTEILARLAAIIDSDNNAVLVAASDGTVIGWTHVLVHHSLTSESVAEISGLVVNEQNRSRGIGRLLLAEAEQWARDNGCRILRLRSNVTRERAHAFYESLGYRSPKTQKVFQKHLAA